MKKLSDNLMVEINRLAAELAEMQMESWESEYDPGFNDRGPAIDRAYDEEDIEIERAVTPDTLDPEKLLILKEQEDVIVDVEAEEKEEVKGEEIPDERRERAKARLIEEIKDQLIEEVAELQCPSETIKLQIELLNKAAEDALNTNNPDKKEITRILRKIEYLEEQMLGLPQERMVTLHNAVKWNERKLRFDTHSLLKLEISHFEELATKVIHEDGVKERALSADVVEGYTDMMSVDANLNPVFSLEEFNHDVIEKPLDILPGAIEVFSRDKFLEVVTGNVGNTEIMEAIMDGEIRYGGYWSECRMLLETPDQIPDYEEKTPDLNFRSYEEQRYHYRLIRDKIDNAKSFKDLQDDLLGFLWPDANGKWRVPSNGLSRKMRTELHEKHKERKEEIAFDVVNHLDWVIRVKGNLVSEVMKAVPDKWAALTIMSVGAKWREDNEGQNFVPRSVWKMLNTIANGKELYPTPVAKGAELYRKLVKKEVTLDKLDKENAGHLLAFGEFQSGIFGLKPFRPQTYHLLKQLVS